MIRSVKGPSSKGAWSRIVKANAEAVRKDKELAKEKPRMETTLERIDRINYQYGDSKKRLKYLDKKNIKTWEQSLEKSKKIKKIKAATSPVEIDFSLAPMTTAYLGTLQVYCLR